MLRALQKYLTIAILIVGGSYLAYEMFLYSRAQQLLPPKTTIAGLEVGGMSVPQATDILMQHYMAPITIYYRQDQVELDPQEIGFALDVPAMIQAAQAQRDQQETWRSFLEFALKQSFDPVQIPLQATHDRDLLLARLQLIASFLDKPAKGPQLLAGSATFQYGEAGYVADIDASMADVEAALYRPQQREVDLVVVDQAASPFDMQMLGQNITDQLAAFSGIGSVFIMDLGTGEEVSINGDVAISGLSILKIAIFLETYRVLDAPPNEYVQGLLYDTAVLSSNYGANLLLHVIAGADNTYEGATKLTEFLRRLGLENTFMAVPYDATPVASRPSTYITPANTDPNLITRPDPAMQTTAEEIGTLLAMIYYCAQGKGALLAIYPDELTPNECQAILDLMVQNEEGNLIRFGVPESVRVSHKHGWDFVTQGDAGVVFSPGGDFVIVEYVTDPNSSWLSHEIGFPLLREITRAAYNYFNFDTPNLEDPNIRAEREQIAREAAAAEAAAAEATEVETEAVDEAGGAGTAVPSDQSTPTP